MRENRRENGTLIWGLVLIALGIVFMLQSLGVPVAGWNLVFGALFCLGGAAFLLLLARGSMYWWAGIPAGALLGLAGTILSQAVWRPLHDALGGTFFLGGLGMGFVLAYVSERRNWWALIPGGVLLTLAAVAGVDGLRLGLDGGALFFLGLGATFLLVYYAGGGDTRWAIYPTIGCGTLGLLLALRAVTIWGYLSPLGLMLAGAYLLYRAAVQRPAE